jgi:glycosyltransferase involved in cell wall biosynthesis
MNAVFYGFQFPHHGQFSAFSALSKAMKSKGFTVRRVFLPSWLCLRGLRRLERPWFKVNEYRLKKDFDRKKLVHYFFPENSLFQAPKWKKGPLVLSCHQPVETLMRARERGPLLSFLEGLKVADAVILMASCELDAYRELAPHAEVLCIPHGVDTDFFRPAELPRREDGKFRILTVGNWLRDYDVWARVVERIASQCPEAAFSVLANPDRLAAAMANLKRGRENVRVLQGISDEQLRYEYRQADVVFLPLQNAWANNALLEGMACGRPIVATDLPAIREYAGNAAVLVEKGSVEFAVQALLQLHDDPDGRAILAKTARTRAEDKLSWKRIAEQHKILYSRLL